MVYKNKGRIYFIGADDGDTIKIGYSVKPDSRIRQIQSGNPERLKVLHVFTGGKSIEAHLHARFGPSRRHRPVPAAAHQLRSSRQRGREVQQLAAFRFVPADDPVRGLLRHGMDSGARHPCRPI